MPSPTFDNIGSVTVSNSTTAAIEFNSVTSAYDTLMIIASLRSLGSGTTDEYQLRFNNDAASNYPQNLSYFSSGTRVNTGLFTSDGLLGIQTTATGNTTDAFSNTSILITNYKTSNKTAMQVESSTFNQTAATLYHKFGNGYWNNTAVVTKIAITGGSNNYFAPNSTATLYGIKNT